MRIGILGGTFNPIHLGHIHLAKKVLEGLSLDKIIFVPAYMPPHKKGDKGIISSDDRYNMIKFAIEGHDAFRVSDIEISQKATSYSIDTVKKFIKIYGNEADLFFIAGSDCIPELDTWKDIKYLKKLCTFMIISRPGFDHSSQPEDTNLMDVNAPEISSSDIRARIREGRDFRDLLPGSAYNYITANSLYL